MSIRLRHTPAFYGKVHLIKIHDLLTHLNIGGFAHIYTVKQTPIEDDYEIACLKRVIVKTKPELNLLRKEVDTMKKLANNKYVVKYYDSNAQKLEDGTYEVLLLMEYCPNKSLLDLMNQHLKTKLSTDQILKIMYEISVAISSMHYMNLIHRDLKVENVLINAKGDFKLADFGSTSGFIAPPKNQEEFQAVAYDILHQTTPQYRAPEMIDLYKNIPIDYKSDIWALGVFLYKLMYYTTPFELQGELAILHGYFQFPTNGPKYPSRLKNLVIIMLQVNPELRPNIYQVIYELCDILKQEVPIEDYYGLGPYNYEEYAKYQQQLQYQQQQLQQQQLQQQQMQLQQQQYQQQQLLEKEAERQKTEIAAQQLPVGNQIPQTQASFADKEGQNFDTLSSAPQKLTRSTNPSSGDLQKLEADAEAQEELPEKTPDPIARQPTGGYNESDAEKHFSDAEERFPSLEELDKEAVEKRFPDVETYESEIPPNNKKSMDEVRSDVFGEKSSDVTRSSSQKSRIPLESQTEEEDDGEDIPKPGIKLSHTEAWTVPAPEPSSNLDLDGVFHGQTPTNSQQGESVSVGSVSRKSFEVGERKSFESAGRKSLEQQQDHFTSPIQAAQVSSPVYTSPSQAQVFPKMEPMRYEASPQSNSQTAHFSNLQQQQQNYFQQSWDPQYFQYQQQQPQQPQSNQTHQAPPQQAPAAQQYPIQAYNSYDQFNSRPAIRGSKNPFPQGGNKNPFPTSKSTLDVKTQPIPAEKSGGNPWAEYTQGSPSGQFQQSKLPLPQKQQSLPQTKPYSTNSVPKVSNSFPTTSPKIQITPSSKLIDLGDSPVKESKQPKLNLDMQELDIDKTSRRNELRFEEMKLAPTRKPSYQTKSPQLGNPPVSSERKSSELSRINLDLEELDLDDENNEDAVDDEDEYDQRHSRRSLSLSRTVSNYKTSRSKSQTKKKPHDEHTRKSSILGFRS